MKVTEDPEQEGLLPLVKAMDTAGVKFELTLMVIVFEVAGFAVTPGMLDVMTQVTRSPLFNDDVVYVLLFVPTFTPFTFH